MFKFIVPAMRWISPKTGQEQQIIDGFYVQGKEPNWTRLKRYRQWQMHIQECAVMAGVSLPLRPTRKAPLYVVVAAYFASRVHCDVGNTFKSVLDALCYVGKEEQRLMCVKRGSDRYTGGLFFAPQYDKECPRAEVTLCTEREFNRLCMDHFIATMDRVIREYKEGGR